MSGALSAEAEAPLPFFFIRIPAVRQIQMADREGDLAANKRPRTESERTIGVGAQGPQHIGGEED